jgi:hypothetical protein
MCNNTGIYGNSSCPCGITISSQVNNSRVGVCNMCNNTGFYGNSACPCGIKTNSRVGVCNMCNNTRFYNGKQCPCVLDMKGNNFNA